MTISHARLTEPMVCLRVVRGTRRHARCAREAEVSCRCPACDTAPLGDLPPWATREHFAKLHLSDWAFATGYRTYLAENGLGPLWSRAANQDRDAAGEQIWHREVLAAQLDVDPSELPHDAGLLHVAELVAGGLDLLGAFALINAAATV